MKIEAIRVYQVDLPLVEGRYSWSEGKYVEVFRDVRFAVTPLAPTEARNVVRGIRGYQLLEGVRGEAPADVDFLVEVLLRLAQLAERHPRIQELDLNPFLAAPDGGEAFHFEKEVTRSQLEELTAALVERIVRH